jgi:hypothetical protein
MDFEKCHAYPLCQHHKCDCSETQLMIETTAQYLKERASDKVEAILRHIKMVESIMQRLAKRLLHENRSLALELVQRSRLHDVSKFSDFEFDNLYPESPHFKDALNAHHYANRHHPEWYGHGSIHNMEQIDVAEMVCDCFARAQEFGTDVKKWFEEEATKKYGFKMTDIVGVWISLFLDLVLVEKFKTT